ncbi:hypothetical protein J8273_0286 [Carpediemonas membranifera]|uniref:Uncharacterized protein n=1 Tax=Carpediemonas membranifera TaxID=201153 RepID=A0A8J6AZA9_9EUKA|nr:hypothetical protein J8273_0286 [Carpediemonas membranifera]|eukprot:KAG9395070.1 hypothetical protein J8273_0286 [Carpediemonas membranifera]
MNQTETLEYLQKHKIDKLVHILASQAAFHQPDGDLYSFFHQKMEEIIAAQRKGEKISLFSPEDLRTIFNMYDPLSHGTLQGPAIATALDNMGLGGIKEAPASATVEQFVSLAEQCQAEYFS